MEEDRLEKEKDCVGERYTEIQSSTGFLKLWMNSGTLMQYCTLSVIRYRSIKTASQFVSLNRSKYTSKINKRYITKCIKRRSSCETTRIHQLNMYMTSIFTYPQHVHDASSVPNHISSAALPQRPFTKPLPAPHSRHRDVFLWLIIPHNDLMGNS